MRHFGRGSGEGRTCGEGGPAQARPAENGLAEGRSCRGVRYLFNNVLEDLKVWRVFRGF